MDSSLTILGAQGSGPMAKAMSIAGMIVAGLLVLIFAADLALKIPFDRAAAMTDVGFLVSGAILGYLAWSAFREAR
jgi:threonine/homoserine/homoserine lactone efflux protein